MKTVINICFIISVYFFLREVSAESFCYTRGVFIDASCVTARNGTGGNQMDCGGNNPCMFYLYTRKNRKNPEFLHCSGYSLPTNSNFNASHQTTLIVHGFMDGLCISSWMREMKDQLLANGCYNVILVNLNMSKIDRAAAVESLDASCNVIAQCIKNIMQATGVGPENFHLIAHSLGSHISGCVGQKIRNLRRITGLDPRTNVDPDLPVEKMLSFDDAMLVDIIHTSVDENCPDGKAGRPPMGHADFYVNGGHNQKACYSYAIECLKKGDVLFDGSNLNSSNFPIEKAHCFGDPETIC